MEWAYLEPLHEIAGAGEQQAAAVHK